MKIDIVAIPKDLLLLQLYNNALYQSQKFDAAPAIRQTVAGKSNGNPLIAHYAVKEKHDANQYRFTEVDLGAGFRALQVDLTDFEVDFTQYDELHGFGTAERVIREIRTIFASQPTLPEKGDFFSEIISTVNKEMLNQLNLKSRVDEATVNLTEPESNDLASNLLRLRTFPHLLEQYFTDPAINEDAKSKAFLSDLKRMIETDIISEKYKKEPVKAFYTTWLMLIDPNIDDQQKRKACCDLHAKHSEQYAGILFELPKIMSLEFINYSNMEPIHAHYEYRQKYKTYYPDITDYFADFVKMVTHANFYTEEYKRLFISRLVNFFQNLTRHNNARWASERDEVKEALSCWVLQSYDDLASLKSLLSEEQVKIIEGFDTKLHDVLEAIDQPEPPKSLRLSFSSYVNWLVLQQSLKKLDLNKLDNLYAITRHIYEPKELEKLYQMIKNCHLDPHEILKNHAILVVKEEDYNDTYGSGLFIKAILAFIKSKLSQAEFNYFLFVLIGNVNPVIYANSEWAFGDIRNELMECWAYQMPGKLIEAIQCSINLKKSSHDTPIQGLVSHIPSKYVTRTVLECAGTQLSPSEFMTFFSVCSNELQQQITAHLFSECNPEEGMEQIRVFHDSYQASIFPTRFKETFTKHLKEVNEVLFKKVKLEHLFGLIYQGGVAQDLDNLNTILLNKNLTHDQRRTELRSLNALHDALHKSQDACAIVIDMFNAIDVAQWPYLFVYFDAAISHWSFPIGEDDLKMFKREQRINTWLNHPEEWESILLKTLHAISEMKFDSSEEGHVASWSLQHVQQALAQTGRFFPGLPNHILKKFFLSDPAKSMIIFGKIKKESIDKYDFDAKQIVNDELIASWLPDNLQRVAILYNIFMANINDYKSEIFLSAPYIRNDQELDLLVVHIIGHRNMHFINFLERLRGGSSIIMQSLSRFNPSETEALLVSTMNDVALQVAYGESFFKYISLLLRHIKYAGVDLEYYINQLTDKQKFIQALCDLDYWGTIDGWGVKPIFKISAKFAPEHFYSKVTQYFESYREKYFSLYIFEKIFGAAHRIAIPPYSSYADYLDHHPDDKDKVAQLILKEIEQINDFDSNAKAFKFASYVIPNLDDLILNRLVPTRKSNKTLDSLVQVYGAERIISKCAQMGLEKQATSLREKFTQYPQILEQSRILGKWFKVMLNPDYRKSDKINPMAWGKIHKINEKIQEVLLEYAVSTSHSNYFEYDLAHILIETCKRAEVSIEAFLSALPSSRLCLLVKVNGEVAINDLVVRDQSGNYLSQAAMMFADQCLSSKELIVIEKQFKNLDEKSQGLLADKVSKLIAHIQATDKKQRRAHQVWRANSVWNNGLTEQQSEDTAHLVRFATSVDEKGPCSEPLNQRKRMLERSNAYGPEYFQRKQQRKDDDGKELASAHTFGK